MRYRWALSLVIVCGFGVTQVHAEDNHLITPPALAGELWSACKDGRIYFRVEGMAWFIRDAHTPPLVTTGNAADPIPGALGQPGTSILFGGNIDTHTHDGAQFTLGYWFDTNQDMGLEATYWFFNTRSHLFGVASTGAPGTAVISRPFFDANALIENADPVALPGVQSGSAEVRLSDHMEGGEFNFLTTGDSSPWYCYRFIAGVAFFSLDENLGMITQTFALPAGSGIADAFNESFRTQNKFVGGQVGVEGGVRVLERLELNARGTFALGGNYESVFIDGLALHRDPNAGTIIGPGGLFTQVTNIGHHNRGSFTYMSEVGVKAAYWWTDYFNMSIGYKLLYLNSVVRAGDQIDRVVSVQPIGGGLVQGAFRPLFSFHETDFWAHGVNFGCELRF
jgi:hypothetical protein